MTSGHINSRLTKDTRELTLFSGHASSPGNSPRLTYQPVLQIVQHYLSPGLAYHPAAQPIQQRYGFNGDTDTAVALIQPWHWYSHGTGTAVALVRAPASPPCLPAPFIASSVFHQLIENQLKSATITFTMMAIPAVRPGVLRQPCGKAVLPLLFLAPS